MEDTSASGRDYRIDAKTLRKNAKFICDAVKSNTNVLLYRCDDCGKVHIRFFDELPSAGETIH